MEGPGKGIPHATFHAVSATGPFHFLSSHFVLFMTAR
jgi:hypothetical protein